MNVARLVASVAGYFYSTGENTVAVHLYGGSTASVTLGERTVRIVQRSDYPWNGRIQIAVEPNAPTRFTLKLRVPGWSRGAAFTVNGQPCDAAVVNGYVDIDRTWNAGDRVELDLPMPVERVYANPLVQADVGRVSLRRGPLIYCVEQADHPDAAVGLLRLPAKCELRIEERGELLGGIVTVHAQARAIAADPAAAPLYTGDPPVTRPAELTSIPYYLWSNRGANAMQVWLPTS
jgi:hypothetical protein